MTFLILPPFFKTSDRGRRDAFLTERQREREREREREKGYMNEAYSHKTTSG